MAVALGLASLGAAIAVAVVLSRPAGASALAVPTHASAIIAWSAGIMIAFGGALGALPRDADDGIVALLRARGVPTTAYVRGRVGGLAVVLALGVGGAVLVPGLAALAVGSAALPAAHACAAALAYALAFSVTLAPLATATLAARRRSAGYLAFLCALALPEVLARATSALLPRGWVELTSLPAALDAIQRGVLSPSSGGFAMARAAAALTAVAVLSFAVVHTRIPRIDGGSAP